MENFRPRTYAARYALIALVIAIAFTITHTLLDALEASSPAQLGAIGGGDLLVVTTPFLFTVLAYLAGRQRDQAVAQARYLSTINQLNRALFRSLDLDQILPEALNQIVAALQMDHAALYLFDRDRLTLRAHTTSLPAWMPQLIDQVQAEYWLPLLLPRTKSQSLVVLDLAGDDRLPEVFRQGDLKSLVSVPLPIDEQSGGLMLIAARRPVHLAAGRDEFLVTMTNQIGAAIARMRPYTELRRRARDLEAIAQVNRTLLASRDLDDLLDEIVNAAQVRFGLPYVGLLWVDEAAGEFFVRAQAGPLAGNTPPTHRQPLNSGLSARVYRTGRPYLARDVRSEPDYIPATTAPVLSSLLTPMKVSGRVIGVMEFDSLGLDAFSEADVAALTTLTDQVTIAAENARLYAEAQRERRRVAAILHSTREVVLLVDGADVVQLMNPAAERVLGLTAAAGVGKPIGQVLTPPLFEVYQWLSNRSADEETPPRELTLASTVYLLTLTTARDEAGAFFGRVLVMQDITYLKQLDQFRTQMIQMASHDLRNPLGVAMGYLELLNDELQPITPLRRQVLSGLENALTRMQNLITDLLEIERIESEADRRRETVALEQLTQAVSDELREQAEAKRQTLTVTAAAMPSIMGDPVRLKQALNNLIGNAIKYTPNGGHIQVRLTSNGSQVIFEVQDDGYGIPKAAQAKLFQRFYRVKAPGTEEIGGTGLGLSLVKAVIEQHGGRISVESDLGQGSTFRVELPVLKEVVG